MDAVLNVLEQRSTAESLLQDAEREEFVPGPDFVEDALRLAELVLALDRWRRMAGFDPYIEQREILA